MRLFARNGRISVLTVIALAFGFGTVLVPATTAAAAGPCDAPITKPIVCENSKVGNPASEWEISGVGDDTIAGFTTDISTNIGGTVHFKIDTPAAGYKIDIYRMGYYAGDGARKVASINPSVALPQTQPNCLSDPTTGLIDCGNWKESASWAIPTTAVSGIYFAHLTRNDTGGDNQIVFVVRDDSSHADLEYQTSDATWQAYNTYGGNSFYNGAPVGRAYKLSYNRPFDNRASNIDSRNFVFSDEYPMVRFLEKNGYDTTYVSDLDTDRAGALIKNHKVFMSVGHDEYWSGRQRANVEAARDAGVNLAFFSGNEVFWKTRWEPAITTGAEANRTLVSYKETHANAKIDPAGPTVWTGTWRDPRFSPPADGGRPENGLTGTIWTVNCCSYAIQVPSAFSKLRLWRNTNVATLAAGQVATLGVNTLGYEWDEDLDNGARPAGLIDMSSTTENVDAKVTDYGSTVAPGTATHSLTLYRAPSGALVFGAGTVQWSWGLDDQHDGEGGPADARMQQATVNLFADMKVQPGTLQSGLVAAAASTDTTAPTSTITTPAAGTTVGNGTVVTVKGTASDTGGGQVGGVEVSTDGGTTWHPASGTTSWTYKWSPTGLGSAKVRTRATDDSGNIETPSVGVSYNVACPCSIFGSLSTPQTVDSLDSHAIEAGLKFKASINGYVTGVRFYKSAANTGTHTGTLWSAAGTKLASVTFANETASGWQQATFSGAVQVTAGTTYVVSYFSPSGHYSADAGAFTKGPVVSTPLTALQDVTGDPNGVFNYDSPGFPTDTFGAANYWVDVMFSDQTPPDNTAPTVTSQTPTPGSSSVPSSTVVTAGFSESVVAATANIVVKDAGGTTVPGTNAYDAASKTTTFTPTAALAKSTTFTATVTGTKDPAGNTMAAPVSWSFKTAKADQTPGVCPCSIWNDSDKPVTVAANDPSAVELGVKFKSDASGTITGVRFYKGPTNTGSHTGTLWSAAGTKLATATFSGESTQGWQDVTFATPVAVTAGTTYIASYHTTVGNYSVTNNQFGNGAVDAAPLHALSSDAAGGNGVYIYGASAFPSNATTSNYWVDVVFASAADTTAPTVTTGQPVAGDTNVSVSTTVKATFSEAVTASSVVLKVTDPANAAIAGAVTYDATTKTATFNPSAALLAGTTYKVAVSGAKDASGNVMTATSWTFTTASVAACPCTLWSSGTVPGTVDSGDPNAVELGVKFRSDTNGFVTGVRFYKSAANTGVHTGTVWSATGTQLATATFSQESASGWQTATFSTPVAVQSGKTYVVSYHTTSGHYSVDLNYFQTAATNSPLLGLATGTDGPNGLYAYGTGAFPVDSYQASNYWVSPVFTTTDTLAPKVTDFSPDDNAGSVSTSVAPTATFDEAVKPASVVFAVKIGAGAAIAGSTSYVSATNTATFTPSAPLAAGTTYSVTLNASDLANNAMPAKSWSFTTATASSTGCPCSVWPDSAVPGTKATTDPGALELGMRFSASVNGFVKGVRFYKGAGNTGTHTGTLWSSTGTQLATATFTAESTTGWQKVTFSTPVAVTAGTVYVVSYHTTTGHYAYDGGFFANSGLTTGPLTALADGAGGGGNGLYLYGSGGFPINSSRSSNYWVDVVFDTAQ